MQTGNVASPDCFNTFGLLGADSSFSIAHFAVPLPVCVAVQPGSGPPVFKSSKLTVSAVASAVAMGMIINVKNVFIIPCWLTSCLAQRRADFLQASNKKRAFDRFRQIFGLTTFPV